MADTLWDHRGKRLWKDDPILDLEPALDHAVKMRASTVVLNRDVDDVRADTQLNIDQFFEATYAC